MRVKKVVTVMAAACVFLVASAAATPTYFNVNAAPYYASPTQTAAFNRDAIQTCINDARAETSAIVEFVTIGE